MKTSTIVGVVIAASVLGAGIYFWVVPLLFEEEIPVDWKREIITPDLQEFFSTFDLNKDQELSWYEAMKFYEWVEANVRYRYDDEYHPEGLRALKAGLTTREQLGDGRERGEYWQKPLETYVEGYGDCEDMAILHLAFYYYWGIESYLACVDVDGDGIIDHGICIIWIGEEALEELIEYQGLAHFYDFEGKKFVIVDSAYSDAYGFIGRVDPFTGEPLPKEAVDFTLYKTYTLEEIYRKWWID